MANSKLTNTYHKIPDNIINEISKVLESCKDGYPGKKKAEFLIKEKQLSYENLRRYKNFFDVQGKGVYNLDSNDDKLNELNPELDYKLRGGNLMKDFVNNKLRELTEKIKMEKKVKSEYAEFDNQYKKETEQKNLKINTDNNFVKNESIIREVKENNKKMIKVSLTVIFNKENKILLLKRSENTNWCPNCWALVGGKIEKGEAPEDGLVREVNEETKIKLEKYKLKKIIKINDVLEYLYLSKVDNDSVELNGEHSDYKWYTLEEAKNLDNVVPDLINYIKHVIL